jgi:hypothetical protein
VTALSGGVTGGFTYDGVGGERDKTIAGTQTGSSMTILNFIRNLVERPPKENLVTVGSTMVFLQEGDGASGHPISDALGSIVAPN